MAQTALKSAICELDAIRPPSEPITVYSLLEEANIDTTRLGEVEMTSLCDRVHSLLQDACPSMVVTIDREEFNVTFQRRNQ